ncbi:thiolase family protein [Shouchella clausii]|uniref:thiolase family protein n=1 Tax=Shouchella clausii TaxID=79880 RepID=UPI00398374FE
MNDVFIVKAKRTAVGKIGGILATQRPEVLAASVIKEIVAGLPFPEIDGVVLGNAVGEGGNIARLSLLESGLPVGVPGVTVDVQCGSGLEAIIVAARHIQAGDGDVYLAGGVESTSLEPKRIAANMAGNRREWHQTIERARFSPESLGDPDMAEAAENVAEQRKIGRDAQDEYTAESYRRAWAAEQKGLFRDEKIAAHRDLADEGIRQMPDRLLKRVPPLYSGGTVTAANSCAKSDGAALVLLMSKQACVRYHMKPMLAFVDAARAGYDPHFASISPVPAIRKLLAKQKQDLSDIDLIELNEAYAVQMVALQQELGLDKEKLNVSGGALAIGHPYGASGAINVCRLAAEMKRRDAKFGLSAIGAAGGLGIAALFANVVDE